MAKSKTGKAQKRRQLKDFSQLQRNPNTHTAIGLGMLEDSMHEDGFTAPITASADGVILDGNARHEKAATVFDGVEPLVIEHDGKRPIIAIRTDIPNADDPMAQRIIVRANRIAQVDLAYDLDVLRELQENGVDLRSLWGNDKDLERLLKSNADDAGADGGAGDEQEQWAVLVTCRNEADQRKFLAEMEKAGRSCRALMS